MPEEKSWRARWMPWIVWIISVVLSGVVGAVTGVQITPPPPPQIVEVPVTPEVVAGGVEFVPTFGWIEDPDVIKTNLDPAQTLQFADTPAGKVVQGDEDVFLWPAVRKVNNRGPPWYPNINQGPVGSCVGAGFKHAVDVCQASQILSGTRAEWKPVSAEVIYGGSRVEVGGGVISGDGSTGSWARDWVRNHGVAPMERDVGGYDLSVYSPQRAREFGRRGVPDSIEGVAKRHLVKGAALVRSWDDVKRAISQGYPVAVCSNQGFRMERDRDGFCRAQGTWAHCMMICGVRTDREGGFILNSWGDNAHTGPVWPTDMPVAGFWAEARVIDRMVRQGDSFALSDIQGFPARRPPWFVYHKRPDRLDPFARVEVALAW